MENAENSYPNALHAWQYLVEQGWKISMGRFYQHRDQKKIKAGKDGRFHEKALIKYARQYLKKKDGSSAEDESDQKYQEKIDAETRKLKAQADHWEIKAKALSGQFVEKSWFERELAARAAVFRSDVENFIRSEAQAMISTMGGDPARSAELIEFMLARVEEWLGRYSEGRTFEVPIMPADEEEKEDIEDEE